MLEGVVIASGLVVATLCYLYTTKPPKRVPLPAPVLTRPIDGKEYHRASILSDRGVVEVDSLYGAFMKGFTRDPSANFLGSRQLNLPGKPYKWLTYRQVLI